MTTDLSTAFEKLVDISQEQTRLMTEHNMLLRQLHERFDRAEELHTKSVTETRTAVAAIVKNDGDSRDRWFKRAVVILTIIVAVSTLLGGGSEAAAVILKMLGAVH